MNWIENCWIRNFIIQINSSELMIRFTKNILRKTTKIIILTLFGQTIWQRTYKHLKTRNNCTTILSWKHKLVLRVKNIPLHMSSSQRRMCSAVNFINVLRARFLYEILAPKPKCNKKKGHSYKTSVRKTLVKLTHGISSHLFILIFFSCAIRTDKD